MRVFNVDAGEEVAVERESDDDYVPKAAKMDRTGDVRDEVNRPLSVRNPQVTGAEPHQILRGSRAAEDAQAWGRMFLVGP